MKILNLTLPFVLLFFLTSYTFAQTKLAVVKYNIQIEGTSTIYDWNAKVNQVEGKGTVFLNKDKILKIEELSIKIPVKDIKSNKTAIDKKMYVALKQNKNPYLFFNFKSLISDNNNQLTIVGVFEIAGKSKEVKFPVNYKLNNFLILNGSLNFNMLDYSIEPPTALFGILKTDEMVQVHYEIHCQLE